MSRIFRTSIFLSAPSPCNAFQGLSLATQGHMISSQASFWSQLCKMQLRKTQLCKMHLHKTQLCKTHLHKTQLDKTHLSKTHLRKKQLGKMRFTENLLAIL